MANDPKKPGIPVEVVREALKRAVSKELERKRRNAGWGISPCNTSITKLCWKAKMLRRRLKNYCAPQATSSPGSSSEPSRGFESTNV